MFICLKWKVLPNSPFAVFTKTAHEGFVILASFNYNKHRAKESRVLMRGGCAVYALQCACINSLLERGEKGESTAAFVGAKNEYWYCFKIFIIKLFEEVYLFLKTLIQL